MSAFAKTGFAGIFIVAGILRFNPFRQPEKVSQNVFQVSNPSGNKLNDTFMHNLLAQYPQFFNAMLAEKSEWPIQVIYTQINQDKAGKIEFTDHSYNLDSENYFYPASTVKLPVAILALQKLNELKIQGLDKNSTMITGAAGDMQTEVYNDPSAPDGRPTIAHYIKKILLVSDNDAFNRLYEFLGQEYINRTLQSMGFTDAQILHRLQVSLNEEQNRATNPIRFYDDSGKLIYEKPGENSQLAYASRNTKMGKGYYSGDKLVNEPFNFSKKNRLSLQDLHTILRSILFPGAVPDKQRFNLTADDYNFLRRYMSMTPGESRFPFYDPVKYQDSYVKFLFYGAGKQKADPGIRIFNKVGDAYGFLIDVAYVVDFKNKISFMLSAVIHCNSDGIFNDDKYDYDTIGFPFMKNLGQVIYDYELRRERKYIPDLSSFQFDYRE